MKQHADRLGPAELVCVFAGARVVLAGDAMIDRFVDGRVERISPEAPVPVLRVERENTTLGGAGNVFANLVELGARPHMIAVVGDDSSGSDLARLLGSDVPGATVEVFVEPGRTTPVKTRFRAGGQQLLRTDFELATPLSYETARRVCSAVEMALENAEVLVLSDYAKGTLPPEVAHEMIAKARRRGKLVLVDPKGSSIAHYAGATLIKPNRAELALATGLPVSSLEELLLAGWDFLNRCGCVNVLITLGGDGMLLMERSGGAAHLIPGLQRQVFDVGGAGDTVLATLAVALAAGGELRSAAELANVAGGVAVGRRGTATVSGSEILHHLSEPGVFKHRAKILDAQGAKALADEARECGARIGFTNGCFDILHLGHITLLERARAACDFLVVGLNSDTSVRQLKGPQRPVNPEDVRSEAIASLSSVGAVVVFEEDTPLSLIEALHPDLLIKGNDYTLDRVAGANLVRSWGGKVMLIDIVPGFSTTGILALTNDNV